jgi:selenocysteine lyase/cysteine desulfurase
MIPPYLHPDGTSILTAKPDHPATVRHLIVHGYYREDLTDLADREQWHSMAHSEPRIETAITAALQLGADWRHLTGIGFEERFKDLLDLLGEAKEENDRLRGIIQDTISYHREEWK